MKFKLQNTSSIDLLQAQAIASYSRCAVLITTTLRTVGFDTEQSIMCFGDDGVQTVKTQLYALKFWDHSYQSYKTLAFCFYLLAISANHQKAYIGNILMNTIAL